MPSARQLSQSLRRWRLLEDVAVGVIYASVKVFAALPSRWVLRLSDWIGVMIALVDRRGRAVGMQNLRVAFGEGMSLAERRRVLRASCQQAVRSVLLLLHVQPMTARRYRRWVELPEVSDAPQTQLLRERGGVLVSGHVGNWEMLLGMRTLFPHFPPTVFLAEEIPHHALNRVVKKLRSHGDLLSALRKGGARAVINVVAEGGTAGLLVDRNVRGVFGGVYAPFFGLEARTSPLPAWLVLRQKVPLFPIFCLPTEHGRYRLWLGPNLAEDLPAGDERTQTRVLLTRVNGVLEDVIRADPTLWNWSLKRFKSRPTQALGSYPTYSLFDPDRGR